MARISPSDFQVAIGPHPARPDWNVLRLTYRVSQENRARVVAALDVLFGPPPPLRAEQGEVDQ
jgi:hypothetical protein